MSVANDNALKIREILMPIFGKEAWGTDLGIGSFLTIEFGRPVKTENKSTRLHGEWNIWLYGCGWRLEQGDCVLVGSEDRRDKIASVIEVLNGQKLLDVKINGPAFDSTFLFENDLRICTFQLYTEEMESWYFYLPDHFVLMIGPGTGYEYTRSD